MSFLSTIGKVITAPIRIPMEIASAIAPQATNLLQSVLNTGFEAAKMGVSMATIPLALTNPLMALGMPLMQQGIQGLQNLTNQSLFNYNQGVNGYQVPYSPYQQPLYMPPYQQRFDPNMMQYANQQIYSQFPQVYPQQYPQNGAGTITPYSMPINPSAVYGSNAATATSATVGAGFAPTGNEMYDLANSIANAPTYSPTEQALLSKIKDPEQRAIQELQMQMQKQALMATVITNLANMRHEMLKAVAQNLRS